MKCRRVFGNLFYCILLIKFKNNNNNNLLNDALNDSYILNKAINNNLNILKKKNLNLLFQAQKTKIENVIILIKIIPFLNCTLIISIGKSKNFYNFFKNLLKKKIKNNIIKVNNKDLNYLVKNFKIFLNFKWELIPESEEINNLRYIIKKYYDGICLKLFDKYLNYNLNNLIKINRTKFTKEDIYKLMSKYI